MNSTSQESRSLAREFGVSEEIMERFLQRFSPRHVATDCYRAEADVMLFVHIPKTAGMSVGRSFQGAFDIFLGVDWQDVQKSFRQKTRDAIYLQTRENKRQVISGHYGWPELQVWRNHELPMKCGTILREPVSRVISNYNYNCSDAHPDNVGFRERFPTLISYARRIPLDVQLTQAIGWVNSFETILTKFIAHYTFLGVTEHLGASLAHLGRTHGLKALQEYHENVGKTPAAPEVITKEIRTIVEERSHNDRRFHQLLMRIFEA